MSSSLVGNHATIKVPYAFNGNVVYASTTTAESEIDAVNFPFSRWDPQWKNGRYVTDINICKADSRGFYYSVNGDTSGTAVYISADGSAASRWMWGLHYSGLRIAGAFSYGIRAKNFNEGWLHEMHIDAFIDACEIGVSLEDCQNTYISAIIQPRRYYTIDKVYGTYAKHGIQLIRSRNTDLSGSRVWDWYEGRTLWAPDNEYQHIAMIGDCNGTIVNDWRYHIEGDTRDRIYTDKAGKDAGNLETITILQEPITRWFKPIEKDGTKLPHFSNGDKDKPLVLKEELDTYFNTSLIDDFDNLLYSATEAYNSNITYNGSGYKKNTALNSANAESSSNYFTSTGFIKLASGNCTIYGHNISLYDSYKGKATNDIDENLSNGPDGQQRIIYFDENGQISGVIQHGKIVGHVINSATKDGRIEYTETEDGFVLKLKLGPNPKYVRFTFKNTNEKIALSLTPISYSQVGGLADTIKVTDANIESTKLNTLQTQVGNITQDVTESINELGQSVDKRFDNLSIGVKQANFILSTNGQEVEIPTFIDRLETATTSSGDRYNVTGYKEGVRINLTNGTEIDSTAYVSTGFIECDYNSYVNLKDCMIRSDGWAGICAYDSEYKWIGKVSGTSLNQEGGDHYAKHTTTDYGGKIEIKGAADWKTMKYIRICIVKSDFKNTAMVAVNQDIGYRTEWKGDPLRFSDQIYAQNVFLTSPNGSKFTLTVGDDGVLVATPYIGQIDE